MRKASWFSCGVAVGMLLAIGLAFAYSGQDADQTKTPSTTDIDDIGNTQPAACAPDTAPPAEDGKLRIVAFGAHPDDCEIKVGGSGAMWHDLGHHVKFVSATNGDIGHWSMAGGPLAQRRYVEVQKAARILGTTTVVLDIHDGELMPSLENRRKFTREIRRWNADVVLSHRPNDYHPDHRYTGVLVQDSAYMVAVPFFCPDERPLQKNPVYLFYHDRFETPNPFDPDIVVAIDSVVERKLGALGVMESQFFEGGAMGNADLVPDDEAGRAARHARVRERFENRFANIANQYRDKLIELYGAEKGNKVRYAEAFEVCEYGRQPTPQELLSLFPFFP